MGQSPLKEAAAYVLAPNILQRLELADTPYEYEALRPVLTDAFNRLLVGKSIYSDALFKGVKLDRHARDLMARRPRGADLMRLNRMLLEQILPGVLERHYVSSLDDEDLQTYRTSLMWKPALGWHCHSHVLRSCCWGPRWV